jgi:hypothetical protein
MHEIELILAHVLGAKLIRGGGKVLDTLGDTAERGLDGLRGIVPQLEVVAHPLAPGSHGWTHGLHGLTPARKREASRRGIHPAHGGGIVVQGDYGWPEEPHA